jgi:hypothetical protein
LCCLRTTLWQRKGEWDLRRTGPPKARIMCLENEAQVPLETWFVESKSSLSVSQNYPTLEDNHTTVSSSSLFGKKDKERDARIGKLRKLSTSHYKYRITFLFRLCSYFSNSRLNLEVYIKLPLAVYSKSQNCNTGLSLPTGSLCLGAVARTAGVETSCAGRETKKRSWLSKSR